MSRHMSRHVSRYRFPGIARFTLGAAAGLALTLAVGACSDSKPAPGGDGHVANKDGSAGDSLVPDGGTASDSTGGGPALQAIIDKLTLPVSAADFALDLDGDGQPDNRLGQIFGVLVGYEGGTVWRNDLALQKGLDESLAKGLLLMLAEVRAASLLDADPAQLQIWMGEDTNSSPLDNFTDGVFRVAPSSPTDAVLTGKIANLRLSAKGDIRGPVPVGVPGKTPPIVTIKRAQVQGRVSAEGIADGVMAGAVPIDEVKTQVVAPISGMIKDYYASRNPSLGDIIVGLIDVAVTPDIDTNGDGNADALSFALGFTAVPAQIVE